MPDVIRGRRLVFPEKCRCTVESFEIDQGALRPDQVLVQTEVSLVSTGTELANYSALDPGVYKAGTWNAYPWHPGYANIGRIVWAGERVRDLAVGQRVLSLAGHASSAVLSPASRAVFPLSDDDDALRLILARMASVAITSLRLSRGASAGKTVAVIGLGLVGNFAAQLFSLAGMRVVAFDPAPRRVELARRCGIAGAAQVTGDAALRLAREHGGGNGCDIVVEAIGNPALIAGAVDMCAPMGEVILLGSPRGPLATDSGPTWAQIHGRGISIVGALEWLLPYHQRDAGHGNSIEFNYHRLLEWIRTGQLRVDGMITHVVRPDQAQETYDGVLANRDPYFGICFDWR